MVKEKKIRKKRIKEPFWKKWGPEAKHITDHAGKIIDNTNAEQLMNFFLYAGTAILGAYATNDLRGLLIGPLGLKLAESENIIAGGAGVALLTTLGLLTISKASPTAVLPTWAWWPTITPPIT